MKWVIGLKHVVFLTFLGVGPMLLFAQTFTPENQVDFPEDPLDQVNLAPDTTASDSLLSLPAADIKPDVKIIDRYAHFRHEEYKIPLSQELEGQNSWEELDRLSGFIQTLGQTGKPYQRWTYGLPDHYFQENIWKDPITGSYNFYLRDAQNRILFLDTKTPYVNVDYMQGPDRLQQTDVTVSRNIFPWWNATFFINRRLSESVYRDMVTDHIHIYLSSHYEAFDKRYKAFVTLNHNVLNDEINGGVPRDAESAALVNENGIVRDSSVFFTFLTDAASVNRDYQLMFFKGTNAPLLSGAQRSQRVQQAYLDHYFDVFGVGERDSAKIENRLTIRNEILWEVNNLRFVNESIDTSALAENLIPVYPNRTLGENDIYENWLSRKFLIRGEGSYSLQTRGGFQVNVNGGLNYKNVQFIKDTSLAGLNSTEQVVRGSIGFPVAKVHGSLRQGLSNLFSADRDINIGGEIQPWTQIDRYKLHPYWVKRDSLGELSLPDSGFQYRPARVSGEFWLRDMNPSLFQTFFYGDSGNSYLPTAGLTNSLLTHGRAEIRYDFPTPIGLGDTLLPMFAAVQGFYSRVDRPLYFNEAFQAEQNPDEALNFLGLRGNFRLRFWRKFYWEGDVTYQLSASTADDFQLRLQQLSVPSIYGKTSLFYDNRKVSFAEQFRIGLDFRFASRYVGQTVDPISGQYFATNYKLPAFVQADVYVIMRLRGVYGFVKVQHANEFMFSNGYFTTPFYPMLERVVTFGVNWSFFN
jgi:hypothetical protein